MRRRDVRRWAAWFSARPRTPRNAIAGCAHGRARRRPDVRASVGQPRMSARLQGSGWLTSLIARVEPHERRALALAFACNFMLLGSYYILRPVRDAMATVFGVDQLQNL